MVLDVEAFRKAGYAAVDQICDYYTTLHERPVRATVEPGYLLEQLPTTAPEQGEEFTTITQDFKDLILPGITHWQHPQFFAYFPSNSTFESMLGEFLASSVSNPGFSWICSPACTELEQVVLDWCAKMFGLSDEFLLSSKTGGGIIIESASITCLTAATGARERTLRYLAKSQAGSQIPSESKEGGAFDVPIQIREKYGQKLVMYGSTQTHSIAKKAAVILGLEFRAVPVSIADNYGLRGEPLRKAMQADVDAGYVPYFVVGTVGTTSSGAIDAIGEIGEVVKQFPSCYLHIDSAWAGVANALPDQRGTLRMDEINKYADSFSTNPHKWGLVGFDCSVFFVRDRTDLTEALTITPAYLRTTEGDAGTVIDYRNWQLSLGRRFRSLKLWFVLRSYGVRGFQKHISDGIEQAKNLYTMIEDSSIYENVTPRSLTLVVFRLNPNTQGRNGSESKADLTDAELNLLNTQLHNRLNARSDTFLTQTILHSIEREIFCIRIALGGVRTKMEDVEQIWRAVEDEGRITLEEWKQSRDASA